MAESANTLPNMETSVPACMQRYIQRLVISYNKEGLLCSKLAVAFQRKYRFDLKYEVWGFKNNVELCQSLPNLIQCVPCGADFKLFKLGLPVEATLPLPKEIFPFKAIIAQVCLPHDVEEKDDIAIVVAEIYNPSIFWFNLYQNYEMLEKLMSDMQLFYKEQHSKYLIPANLIQAGWYCVNIIYDEYQRALIVNTHFDEGNITLFYIDFGTTSTVAMNTVCYLAKEFAQLPAQALRGRMANICPVRYGHPWPMEATYSFERLITNRRHSAKIFRIDLTQDRECIEMYLADVSDEVVVYLNEKLIDDGIAQCALERNKNEQTNGICGALVTEIHLFPTFIELENGLAPDAAQMKQFDRNNIPIYFAIPQYFTQEMISAEEIDKLVEFYEQEDKFEPYPWDIDELEFYNTQQVDLSIFGALEGEIRLFKIESEEYADLEEVAKLIDLGSGDNNIKGDESFDAAAADFLKNAVKAPVMKCTNPFLPDYQAPDPSLT